jgi:tetratricopeptide (TPR) repeat protein/RsiW-degrading membrane proteinase PrsW (M82 family)
MMNATLISPLAALPTVLVSGLLLTLAIVRLGRGKFPAELFGAAFSVGVVMGTLVLVAEAPFDLKVNPRHFSPAVMAFGFAAFPEEAAKFAGFYLFVRGHWLRRDARALVLGAAAAALGFALFEDVLYIAAAGPKWGSVAAARSVTAIPMHVFLGVFGGFALAWAEASRTRLAAALCVAGAWIAASLLHGFYDLALMITDAKPPYPQYVEASAHWLSVNSSALLHAVALSAAFGVVVSALLSVRAVYRPPLGTGEAEPPVIRPNWLLRLALARATGWIAGALLVLISALFLAMAAVLSFIADMADPVLLIALPAVFLIGMALLLMRSPMPRTAGARSRPVWRRAGWAVAATLAALIAFAGYHWGEKPARTMAAFRLAVGGMQMAVKGDYEGAIREYDRALTVDPDFVDALANRAKANDILHRYDRALADLDRAVALQPKRAALLVQRSELHTEMHDSVDALADLDRALALSPNDPLILVERAGAYSDAGDDARAAADLAQAAALAPKNADVLMAQTNALIKSGDFDRARQNLDEVIKANPGAANAYFVRGRLSLYRDDAAKAVADLERASAMPVTPYPAMWLFVARARGGLDGGAQLATQTRSWPSGSWPYPVIQQMLGRFSAADARAAASNDDERCEADFYNGELLLAHGGGDSATEALRRAFAECPLGFIEREGANAELKRLDREAAAPPSAPQPNSAAPAASASPAGAATPIPAPAPRPSATDATSDGAPPAVPTPVGSSAPPEVERASASGTATITAQSIYSGTTFWSFIDRGSKGSELDAELMFSDPSVHGEFSLRRVPSPGEPRYELLFLVLASDRAVPPLSLMNDQLGAPTVNLPGSTFALAAGSPFLRINDTTYRLIVSASEIQPFLQQVAKGRAITVKLGATDLGLQPNSPPVVTLNLDAKTARVAQAAADAWR